MLVYIFRHRLLGTIWFLLIVYAILFSAYRIYMTSNWLLSLRDYIMVHDAQQKAEIAELRRAIDHIEARLGHP